MICDRARLELESRSPFPALLQGAGAAGCAQGAGCRWGELIPLVSPATPAPCTPEMTSSPLGLQLSLSELCFKGQLIPILPPPMAFFISFWLGIRHVLTEQTFCCPQNPPPRREATSSLCRCPEPVLGWGEPGLGPRQPFKGKAEPFRVTSRAGAGAWLQLSAPLQSINRFLL